MAMCYILLLLLLQMLLLRGGEVGHSQDMTLSGVTAVDHDTLRGGLMSTVRTGDHDTRGEGGSETITLGVCPPARTVVIGDHDTRGNS